MIKTAFAKIRQTPLLILLAASGLILVVVTLLPAASGDNVADSELGQIDFTHSTVDYVRAQGFALSANTPAPGIAVDTLNGCVYVADQSNNRVLGWRNLSSLNNGDAAEIIIGQHDQWSNQANTGGVSTSTLSSPAGVAVDPNGNLYVADQGNQRVVEYTTPCVTAPPYIGNLTITVQDPWGLATDSEGNLFVADTQNNRVLEYNTPLDPNSGEPGAGDTNADNTFGQTTGTDCNQSSTPGAPPTANTLCGPYGVATDGDNLYVADTGNNRVVAFVPTGLGAFGSDPAAVLVLGQHKFTQATAGCGAVTNSTALCAPRGVAIDSSRNVYIADTNNNRVTEYNDPSRYAGTTPEPYTMLIGQPNASGNLPNAGGTVSANGGDGLWTPAGVATIPSATGIDLLVLDNHNYRVLRFSEAEPDPVNTTPDLELGQSDLNHSTANFIDGAAYSNMSSVVVDRNSTPQHLYVVDSKNNRVLGYNDATNFQNGAPADLVIGQPDPYTTICNTNNVFSSPPSDSTLCLAANPNNDAEGGAAAVDSQGNLWVSDTGNSRIVEFPSPFDFGNKVGGVIVGEAASKVLGQPDLNTGRTTSGCPAASQTDLCEPAGLGFDSNDNLYVADFGYNRVLEYTAPGSYGGSNPEAANRVLGQGNAGNNYIGASCNLGAGASSPSSDTLCKPMAVALDLHDNVYVADFTNSRVLEYDDPLSGTGTPGIPGSAGDVTADLIFGQGTTGGTSEFTTATCGNGGSAAGQGPISASSLCQPAGVNVDPFGSVFIADQANNRVLGYPETNNPPANVIAAIEFGQGQGSLVDFTDNLPNNGGLGADSLNLAVISGQQDGLATDAAGDLFVVDAGNIRLLGYNGGFLSAPTPTGSSTATPTITGTPTVVPTPTLTPSPVSDRLKITPQSMSFPKELWIGLNGVTSPLKTLTLKVPKKGPAITVIGMTAPHPFAIDLTIANACQENAPMEPGGKCEIGLTYTPTQAGKQTGALTITNNGEPHKIPITLKGTGEAGKIKIKPATVSFKKTTVGTASAPITLTLTNDNSLPITMSGFAITGTDAAEFTVSDPNGCGAQSMAAESSCTVTLNFTPAATGKQTASLSISDDLADSPQAVKLKGTGK